MTTCLHPNALSLRHLLLSLKRPIHGSYRPRQTLTEPRRQQGLSLLRPRKITPGWWGPPLLIRQRSQRSQLLLVAPLRRVPLHQPRLRHPSPFQHSYMPPSRSVYGQVSFILLFKSSPNNPLTPEVSGYPGQQRSNSASWPALLLRSTSPRPKPATFLVHERRSKCCGCCSSPSRHCYSTRSSSNLRSSSANASSFGTAEHAN